MGKEDEDAWRDNSFLRQEGTGGQVNEKVDILVSWEQVKNTCFGKWLVAETEKSCHEAVTQFMTFSDLAPLLRVQGFRAGVNHWRDQLADLKRQNDLDEKKRKGGFLQRIGLGG